MANKKRKKTTMMIIETDRRMLFVFIVAILILLFCMGEKSYSLYKKIELKQAEAAVLEVEKAQELKIQAENEEYGKRVHTLGFAEEYGRSNLGLVYPDEKVIKGE